MNYILGGIKDFLRHATSIEWLIIAVIVGFVFAVFVDVAGGNAKVERCRDAGGVWVEAGRGGRFCASEGYIDVSGR